MYHEHAVDYQTDLNQNSLCAPACWVVYLCPCTIACLPAVGQEFHRELMKQQEPRGSRGNGHKMVPLTAAIRLLPNALLFSAPVPVFSASFTSCSLICSRLLCNIGPTSGIDCWVSPRAIQEPLLSWAMTFIFFPFQCYYISVLRSKMWIAIAIRQVIR